MTISADVDSYQPHPGRARDDAEELLLRAERNARVARRADHERLALAAEWAWLHERPADARAVSRLDDKWTELGSTRLRVYEFAAAELAVSLEIHPLAAQRLMGDAVDLQVRLPRTWAAVTELRLDGWVARKIASKTRELRDDRARLVDAQIAEHLGVLPPGRLFAVVDARVVEADLVAADARAERARNSHGVWPTRPDAAAPDTGGLFIRGHAADIKRFSETVDHVAHRLAEAQTASDDEGETLDQLRARAVGLLADPEGAVEFLAGRNPARGRTTLYVHTTLDQLTAPEGAGGVARVEDLGPFTRDQLIRLLGHEHVTVKPVIDLADHIAADCYEIPAAIAERVHLVKPADVFPHANSLSRHQDNDHAIAYESGGPPGQTRVDNLGKMVRRHHRVKTHAPGWTLIPLPGHRYLWITPHGRYRLTDAAGTHVVTDDDHEQRSRLETYVSNLVLAS